MKAAPRASVPVQGVLLLATLASVAAVRPQEFTLVKSQPAADATVEAVSEIRLWFNEAPMEMGPETVSIRVLDEGGRRLASGDASPDPEDFKVYSLTLTAPLPAGTHTAAWHTMAEDGTIVEGEFSFTVSPR